MLQRAALPSPLASARLRSVHPAWIPVLIGGATFLAFSRSFLSLAPLLGAENPAGLSPIIPFLVIWLAAASVRRRERSGLSRRGQLEGAIDLPIGLALLGSAAWLLWRGADTYGWYFWSSRLDLLAAGLFALGLSVLLSGAQTVYFHRLAAVGALLLWPEPLIWLQAMVSEPLSMWTAKLARPLATSLGAHLLPAGPDPRVLIGSGPQQWRMIVADACSGSSAGMAVLASLVPASVHFGIPWRKALPWMGIGALLVLAANIARVAGLVVAADRIGAEFALGTLHPVLGAALLGLVFFALWVFMPGGKLPPAPDLPRRPLSITARTLAVVLGLTALFALSGARLSAFAPLPPIGAPGGTLQSNLDYFKVPTGWRISARQTMPVQNLFGPRSESYALTLRSADGARIYGQLITTPDKRALRAYGLEACRVYHGGSVVGTRMISLDGGAVATLINTMEPRSRVERERLSVLYWEAPFTLAGRSEQMHARVALFVEQSDEDLLPAAATPGIAPGGAAYDRAATLLAQLASDMTRQLLAGGASPSR
ncbi:MAG TPA: exosortase/archaeosortase family protein [Chloroflexota bacterium]|nr:exosortase/archaeosortase family protein [Chloroflexota bacterium]